MGETSEEAEEIILNKKPKIGFSTRNSYQPMTSGRNLGK